MPRTASQYGSSASSASSDRPVSRSVVAVAATIAASDGCEVIPAIGAAAPSTASTPASIAAR